jgi:ribosomal protein S18 acetylase RimI-like enzyme
VERTQDDAAAAQFRIRRAAPRDHEVLRVFLSGLSAQTRYLRFFSTGWSPSGSVISTLAGGGRTDALLAVAQDAVIGHAMAVDDDQPGGIRVSDIGVMVTDAWQRRGVGSALLRLLTARAQSRGASGVVMEVLAENQRVLDMIARQWPDARYQRGGPYLTVRAALPGPPPALFPATVPAAAQVPVVVPAAAAQLACR